MQGIDALGYEEVMTFLRSTPANLFFKDTECRYLFISDVRTFFPYGEGQEEDVLGKTDLEIWSSEEQARFYYEQDQKVLATGEGTSFITEVPRKDGTAYYQRHTIRSKRTPLCWRERSSASWGLLVISRSGCGWKNRPRTGPFTMN